MFLEALITQISCHESLWLTFILKDESSATQSRHNTAHAHIIKAVDCWPGCEVRCLPCCKLGSHDITVHRSSDPSVAM